MQPLGEDKLFIIIGFNEIQSRSLRVSQTPPQLIIQHSLLFNSKYIADFKDKPDPES